MSHQRLSARMRVGMGSRLTRGLSVSSRTLCCAAFRRLRRRQRIKRSCLPASARGPSRFPTRTGATCQPRPRRSSETCCASTLPAVSHQSRFSSTRGSRTGHARATLIDTCLWLRSCSSTSRRRSAGRLLCPAFAQSPCPSSCRAPQPRAPDVCI